MGAKRYTSYGSEEILTIAGERVTVRQAMEAYRPVFYIHKEIDTMEPKQLLCEVIHSGGTILFNYYLCWPDERHPVYPLHLLYRWYRTVYYGSPMDIEYVQIGVDYNNGDILDIAFERDPKLDPNVIIPMHHRVTAHRNSAKEQYHVLIAGDRVVPRHFSYEEKRLRILVATWNHTYDFYNGKGRRLEDVPLVALTDDLYAKYYMERRSKPPGV